MHNICSGGGSRWVFFNLTFEAMIPFFDRAGCCNQAVIMVLLGKYSSSRYEDEKDRKTITSGVL